jgi:peptidoglycan hydrolase CwlO-like protein
MKQFFLSIGKEIVKWLTIIGSIFGIAYAVWRSLTSGDDERKEKTKEKIDTAQSNVKQIKKEQEDIKKSNSKIKKSNKEIEKEQKDSKKTAGEIVADHEQLRKDQEKRKKKASKYFH